MSIWVADNPLEHGDLEASRSRRRYKRAFMNGLTSVFTKLIVLTTTIISVPLTLRYLGSERYGLWMTITSVVLFLGFADFGIGNGLTAGIAAAEGSGRQDEARREVSCAFYLLIAIAGFLGTIFFIVYPHISWSVLYGTKSVLARSEAGPATAVLIVCTILSMPLGTVLRIQLGYQEGYISDLWNAGGNLCALFGIVLATRMHGGLQLLVCAVAGAPLLATTANFLVQFAFVRPELRPRLKLFDVSSALRLASTGSLFFIQQCLGLIYYVSDNIVISREMGAAQVAQYAVLQRIFSVGLVAQYFTIPLWPAIGEAVSRGDFIWAKRTAMRAISLSLGAGAVCGAILLFLSRYLMKRWSGVDIGAPDSLRLGFAVWVMLVGYIAAMNAILNHPATMKRHLIFFGAASLTSLFLKIAFARNGSLSGVIWATTIAFALIYVVPATRLAFDNLDGHGERP